MSSTVYRLEFTLQTFFFATTDHELLLRKIDFPPLKMLKMSLMHDIMSENRLWDEFIYILQCTNHNQI